MSQPQVITASREIDAPAATVFELLADPAQHASWDGNDNVVELVRGGRVRATGEVFAMRTTKGNVRDNRVVAFEEGRLIAWRPGDDGGEPAGHEWRWEVEPLGEGRCRATHTYDWRELTDERRRARAESTTERNLSASLDKLAQRAEAAGGTPQA